MAKSKLSDGDVSVKYHNMFNLSFVHEDEVQKYLKSGYQHLMIKVPNLKEILNLSAKERRCLRILINDNLPKQIASDMNVKDRTTHYMLGKI